MIDTSISDKYADCSINFIRDDCTKRIEIYHKTKRKFIIYVWTYDSKGREDSIGIIRSSNGHFCLTNASIDGGEDFR